MKDKRQDGWIVLACCVLVSAGCMVGPDYKRPKTAAEPNAHYQWLPAGWTEAREPDGPSPWWRSFNDPVTTELVDKALRNNTDLKAAVAGVERSVALLAQAHGVRLPDVSFDAGRSRNKMSFVLPDISTPMGDFGGRMTSLSTTYSQQITVSYILDLFGRLRRSERAAVRDLLATEADTQALAHAIVAQVVQSRVQIDMQQRLLGIADATITSWQRSLEVTQQRYEGGLVGPLDVRMMKQNLEAAKAQRIALEQTLALTHNALDVLCGQRPGRGGNLKVLPDMPPLSPVPADLPAALLDRRPDVQASELRLAAATERIGVSIAQMYPDLTLTGSAGFMSDEMMDMVNTDFSTYTAVIGLMAPIYRGGQLRAGVRAAKATTEEAAQRYAGTVLTALREVEDALVKHQTLLRQIEQLDRRLQLAQESERMAQERYIRGAEPILVLLETQRMSRLAENELALAQGQLWLTRIQLHLALGGDWGTGIGNAERRTQNSGNRSKK
jgi:NodT family efflux transporter outer membrane factor (OMF) lipoprotein